MYKDLDTLVANVREHVIESVLGSMAKRDKPLRVRFAWPGVHFHLYLHLRLTHMASATTIGAANVLAISWP